MPTLDYCSHLSSIPFCPVILDRSHFHLVSPKVPSLCLCLSPSPRLCERPLVLAQLAKSRCLTGGHNPGVRYDSPRILPSFSARHSGPPAVFTSRSWAIRLQRSLLFTGLLPSIQSSGSQSILWCQIKPSTDNPLHLALFSFSPRLHQSLDRVLTHLHMAWLYSNEGISSRASLQFTQHLCLSPCREHWILKPVDSLFFSFFWTRQSNLGQQSVCCPSQQEIILPYKQSIKGTKSADFHLCS